MQENEKKHPKHLLIIRLSALGDVAMTVPIILALRQQYPTLKITVVSKAFQSSIFKDIPEVNFFPVDFDEYKNGVFGLNELYKDLSKFGIDAYADLHNVLRTKVINLFFKLDTINTAAISKGRSERKELTALKEKQISPIKSIFERHADVCKKLNLPIDLSTINMLDKQALSKKTKQLTGEKKSYWIGVAPFAAYRTKVYDLESMKQVIKSLVKADRKVLLFGGGKTEIDKLEILAADSDNSINMAGKLSFDEELALISNLDLMLSMDSGNGHLASMYGVPVITMWGNTHPYAGFVPFRQPLENSLIPDLTKFPFIPTSVYGNKVIPGYEDCMKTIPPASVISKINSVLSNL
ncbi:glycosyltransferase family 9 protein [Lutimonas sp.]|uniref:glycosyltransferase family 9 protein n=1 Tax=Lutimonas sp. TaxID=1872403 RepID=UPI003D9B1DA8